MHQDPFRQSHGAIAPRVLCESDNCVRKIHLNQYRTRTKAAIKVCASYSQSTPGTRKRREIDVRSSKGF